MAGLLKKGLKTPETRKYNQRFTDHQIRGLWDPGRGSLFYWIHKIIRKKSNF